MITLNSTFFLRTILLALAIAPAFALGLGNRNLLLIGVMLISPIVLITAKSFRISDIWIVLFILSIILSPLVNHPESMRWSTVMYTILFCSTFIAYNRLLYHDSFSLQNYIDLLKYIIYAYFIVLLIQQLSVLLGLPIFNVSNYDPTEPWKLNSLAPEPSHSARIVAVLMYSYITIKELVLQRKYNFKLDIQEDRFIWLSFLWTMLTMGSGTAFLFIGIVFLKFTRVKSLIPIMFLVGIVFIVVNIMGNDAMDRTYKFLMATLTFDIPTIMKADHSASMRVVPLIILFDMIDLTTFDTWFGHGIDSVSTFLSRMIYGLPEGASGGGLLMLLHEYGFLSFLLFVIFSISSTIKKGDYSSMIFWFMLVFMNALNTQIVWLTIILLFTNKYFEQNKDQSTLKTENEK